MQMNRHLVSQDRELALSLACYGIVVVALAGGMWIAGEPVAGSPSLALSGLRTAPACGAAAPCPGAGTSQAESQR